MTIEDEVRRASDQFYAALNSMANGDAGPMTPIWSHNAEATTMHPIGGRDVGWAAIQGVWAQIAGIASDGHIQLTDQLIRASGDMAYEVGVEKGHATFAGRKVDISHRVTNIYRREDGAWKIVHHHTDESPAMIDLLKSLQAGS